MHLFISFFYDFIVGVVVHFYCEREVYGANRVIGLLNGC